MPKRGDKFMCFHEKFNENRFRTFVPFGKTMMEYDLQNFNEIKHSVFFQNKVFTVMRKSQTIIKNSQKCENTRKNVFPRKITVQKWSPFWSPKWSLK